MVFRIIWKFKIPGLSENIIYYNYSTNGSEFGLSSILGPTKLVLRLLKAISSRFLLISLFEESVDRKNVIFRYNKRGNIFLIKHYAVECHDEEVLWHEQANKDRGRHIFKSLLHETVNLLVFSSCVLNMRIAILQCYILFIAFKLILTFWRFLCHFQKRTSLFTEEVVQ